MNRYVEPPTATQEELAQAVEADDVALISQRLIGLALDGTDPSWMTATALELAGHDSVSVRRASAITFGHLARLHRHIDRARVLPVLERLSRDPEVAGNAADALDDIEHFVPPDY